MNNRIKSQKGLMKQRKKANRELKVGEMCVCPTCGTSFMKETYQQVFCKTKGGTVCKDGYWNFVDESKRNNTTRISPANQMNQNLWIERHTIDEDSYEYRMQEDERIRREADDADGFQYLLERG